MIKLNNKKITYVALADSSNSLKAPKEIWYADSNNSVKLVYRRKDALIEGVDYEKYNLLNSYTDEGVTLPAQGADISVNPIPLDNKVLTIELGKISRNIFICGKSPWFIPMWCMYVANQYIMQLEERNGNDNTVHNMTYSWNTSNVVTLDFQNKVARLGSNSFNIDGSNYNFDGFHSVLWQNPRTVGKIKISDELHLIPCKLLKPVPKWLDANGIRRQVGECGMIDLVSGKFYGNVKSVGTFTVENYYERKEWLVGDGSAYIDTGHNVNEDLDYETKAYLLPNTYLFWYRSGSPYYDQTMVVRSDNPTVYTGTRVSKNSIDVRIDDIENIEVQWNNNKVSVNGVNYIPSDRAITFNYELYLFYAYLADTALVNYSSNNVKCAYFRFLDSNRNYIQNLIPCTLTMDLPASMDANNIARTKGTSGMWDLVSDKFYGNVASSGMFKAVNLAEGVDYEVHQWLVRDESAYIQGIEYDLWNNHLQFQIGKVSNYRSYIDYSNSDYNSMLNVATQSNMLMVIFRQTPDGSHIADINPWTSPDVVTMEFYIDNSTFYCVQNGVTKVSSPTQSNATESVWSSIYPQIRSAKMSYIREVLPDNTYKSNLVPVKLLRSIPSKYDANGIARQAGECGMYDTVNDVFYGNVASSGSFSVEDDN